MSKFLSLKEKLENPEYLKSLCYRRRKELEICEEMLTDDELEYYSSIDVAYRKARKRYLDKYYSDVEDKSKIFVRYSLTGTSYSATHEA